MRGGVKRLTLAHGEGVGGWREDRKQSDKWERGRISGLVNKLQDTHER